MPADDRSPSPRRRGPTEWRWFLRVIFLPFVVTRLALFIVGEIAMCAIPRSGLVPQWHFSPHPWITMWCSWDAGWYLSIVRDGYFYTPGKVSSVNFAPLFPMLMKGVCSALAIHGNVGILLVGIVLSNLFLLVALYGLVKLVRLDFDDAMASRVVFYLLVFPTSLFLSAVYPESLFIGLSVFAFYEARHGRWLAAGLLGGLAGLARPHGVMLVLPLAFEYLYQRRYEWRRIRPDVLWLALVPALFALWPLYLYHLSGDPMLITKTHEQWHWHTAWPWVVLADWWHGPHVVQGYSHAYVDMGFTLVYIALVVAAWRRLRPSYAIFATVMLLVIISAGGALGSITRYGLEIFPLFLVLAAWGRHELFDRCYTAMAMCLGGVFMALYCVWYFVA